MNTSWKTIIFYVLDVILAFYLVMAITSWNTPDKKHHICTKVNINISDSNNSGFLSAEEIKAILEKDKLYPLNRQLSSIEPRKIEEALTAQCYITENGHINIRISQRMPIIRIKNNKGEDYYLDDNGGILPNSKYTSDLIIATGDISKWFAHFAITPMAKAINKSEFWLNQIEQINVRPDRGIELVPRVGNHIIFIGYLPIRRNKAANDKGIDEFVTKKLERTEKFYRYGLSQAGWNKYSYIDVEFDNQIICKRRAAQQTTNEHQQPKQEEKIQTEVSE